MADKKLINNIFSKNYSKARDHVIEKLNSRSKSVIGEEKKKLSGKVFSNLHENKDKDWTNWNVGLWINNDEGLYRKAIEILRRSSSIDRAAKQFIQDLNDMGITHTPDGAEYTFDSVLDALEGFEE